MKDAVSVELRDANLGLVSGVEATAFEGSVEVSPAATTLYVLSAFNDRGVRDSQAVAVRLATGPESVTFMAAPDFISAGDTATLAWSAPGARAVTLRTQDGTVLDVGGQVESGTVQVTPSATTTYELSVGAETYSAQVRVLPRVIEVGANPAAVVPGAPVTLSWKTAGATRVTVTRVGTDLAHEVTDAGAVADGSYQFMVPAGVAPETVFSFVIAAHSADGGVSERPLTLYVAGNPAVETWTVPEYVSASSTFAVTYATSEAHTAQILRDGQVVWQSS